MSTSSNSAASARAAPANASSAPRQQIKRRERVPARGVTRFEYVHVMVDDHSRLAFAEVLDARNGDAAIGVLRRALGGSQNAASGSSER